MIFSTTQFLDIISYQYPKLKKDIISSLYPQKWIYIRDIISFDIYPLQVWLLCDGYTRTLSYQPSHLEKLNSEASQKRQKKSNHQI